MSEAAPPRLLPLDGLRALAIVLVLLHHGAHVELGWAGVHLFFVLSGFLITGILRRERTDRHFWAPFYLKRATRILPPLLVFFAMCALLGEVRLDGHTAAYAFFGANIMQTLPHPSVDDLTVLWSLAVEEHFYLLWPLAIRYLDRRAILWLASAIVVLSPLARIVATHGGAPWYAVYFLTCFQLDGLAMGSLLALLLEQEAWRERLRRFAAPVFVTSLAALLWLHRLPWFQREANSVAFNGWGYSLLVLVAGSLLLYLVVEPRSWTARALSLPPLTWLGGISYGVYLYHGPVWHEALNLRTRFALGHGREVQGVATAVVALLAWLSFRLYEQPLIRLGRRRAKTLGDTSHAG